MLIIHSTDLHSFKTFNALNLKCGDIFGVKMIFLIKHYHEKKLFLTTFNTRGFLQFMRAVETEPS